MPLGNTSRVTLAESERGQVECFLRVRGCYFRPEQQGEVVNLTAVCSRVC